MRQHDQRRYQYCYLCNRGGGQHHPHCPNGSVADCGINGRELTWDDVRPDTAEEHRGDV